MQCPRCLNETSAGAFCQHCGAALGTQPPQSGPAAPPPPRDFIPPAAAYGATQPGLSDNAAGAIAYLTFIPAVIFLIMEPYARRPFVRFHAWQCLGLTVASIALHFLVGAMVFIFHAFTFLLSSLVSLLFFVLWLVCVVSAAQGGWFKVPVIGDIAMQQSRR
jgi:uncharacterized membrane protein